MPTTTTIHVPMSLNRQFATQACLLVRSLERHARLPGDWRVVLTVGRDTDLELDTPLLDWTRDFPVSVHQVREDLVRQFGLSGTGLQMHLYEKPNEADVTLFMDADMVVVGPLTELVESVAREPVIAGWPAWQPPARIDIDEVLAACGVGDAPRDLVYSGYGLSFWEPKHCPPYYNLGFLAVNGEVVRDWAKHVLDDFRDVLSRYGKNHYCDQLAVCVSILRQGYRYRALDMRYNASNGDWDPDYPPPFEGEECAAIVAAANACVADARVLHYCVQSENFSRKRDMDGLDRVHAFCERSGLDWGSTRLQEALRSVLKVTPPVRGVPA